jgi:hypothetical protein
VLNAVLTFADLVKDKKAATAGDAGEQDQLKFMNRYCVAVCLSGASFEFVLVLLWFEPRSDRAAPL